MASFLVVQLQPAEVKALHILSVHGRVSRTDLAELLGYSRASITPIVNRLVQIGIIEELGEGESSGGRRPRMLDFNGKFGFLAGVDMGATSLDVALADFSGQIITRQSEVIDVRDGPEIVLSEVCRVLSGMLTDHNIPVDRLLGIGVGVPGPVEFSTGLLIAPPIMPGWENYPIRAYLRSSFPMAQVAVDNDVNVMALGESRFGQGRGVNNFLFVKIGTGIGSGIFCDGRIYRGSTGCAGDIGHICVDREGIVCRCGNVGCLEAMTAAPMIASRGLEAAQSNRSPALAKLLETEGTLTAYHVGVASSQGDRVANEIIETSGTLIGEVLASLVNFFNPSLILIGGGVSNIGDRLLSAIRQAVLKRSLPLSTRHLTINKSAMGEDAGVRGALALALESILGI
jgi:glucokinase-like ROK family protein